MECINHVEEIISFGCISCSCNGACCIRTLTKFKAILITPKLQVATSVQVTNVGGINSSTYTDQYQGKNSNPFCAAGNQVQGNIANTRISAGNVGLGNVSGISNSTSASQRQNANCSFPYFP